MSCDLALTPNDKSLIFSPIVWQAIICNFIVDPSRHIAFEDRLAGFVRPFV